MARFSAQFTQRVRDATDLVELAGEYTELRRVGADRMSGRCPLHDERTPSFTVTPAGSCSSALAATPAGTP